MTKVSISSVKPVVGPAGNQMPIQKLPRKPFPRPKLQQWAPAWFYSALNWLGKSYYDANNTPQLFNTYMAGSDVDPYASIGSTRLFFITRIRESFRLSIANDIGSIAEASGGTLYPQTDEGIRDMYLALAGSAVFAMARLRRRSHDHDFLCAGTVTPAIFKFTALRLS